MQFHLCEFIVVLGSGSRTSQNSRNCPISSICLQEKLTVKRRFESVPPCEVTWPRRFVKATLDREAVSRSNQKKKELVQK